MAPPFGLDPAALHGLATDLLASVAARVAALPPELVADVDKPTAAAVWPERPDLSRCECPGQLWAYVEQVAPSTRFPQVDVDPRKCTLPPAAVVYVVGFAVCTPNDGSARGPSDEAITAAARRVHALLWALWQGVVCQATAWGSDVPSLPGLVTAVPDEGGCVGYEARLTARIPTFCNPCP